MALIELQKIIKTYPMGVETVRALDGIDLRVEEGEFLAILGPSGSGKSTLMHILGFLDNPTSGTIHFDGKESASYSAAQRAGLRSEKIGFVFQIFNLLPRLNVYHNVILPLSYHHHIRGDTRVRALKALQQVGLEHRIRHRPSQLSGGQRQRVAIARALINEPRLILADEPTGNLDSGTAQNILGLFSELNRQGRTIVLVTHDAQVAAFARRQIHMLDGRIVKDVLS
ncbi:MAG: ABC transporter ATP-binding protein [Lentisphaerota bacterium]